jgi:hypothetical protein
MGYYAHQKNKLQTRRSQVTDKLDHIMLYQVHLAEFITFSGCTDSCNSNYHTITTKMAAVALGKEITGIYLCIDS